MNIFSTVGFTPAGKEKDHETKEKARVVESHAVEIREKKRMDILKKNRMTESRGGPQEIVNIAAQVPNQGQGTGSQLYLSLAIQSLDAETRAVVDQIYKEGFKFDQFTELVIALNSPDLVQ